MDALIRFVFSGIHECIFIMDNVRFYKTDRVPTMLKEDAHASAGTRERLAGTLLAVFEHAQLENLNFSALFGFLVLATLDLANICPAHGLDRLPQSSTCRSLLVVLYQVLMRVHKPTEGQPFSTDQAWKWEQVTK
ncbi:hypothetical protein RF11_09176 [Thelohanellus kitauei]|uniref:Uncharacterized protein n=1 Tax=Thelohanellus kitauei TaxID=669202 RepID=A0A0C2MV05_THEKT|nr:hypothetical protein RF11_09176 [Thelohanellus kitauei]